VTLGFAGKVDEQEWFFINGSVEGMASVLVEHRAMLTCVRAVQAQ